MSSVVSSFPQWCLSEQPALFHRSRYPSETKETIAGQLLGRSSTNGSKSFVTVKVEGINPRYHKKLTILVCVVDSENYLHPFILNGSNCVEDGYYQSEKTVDQFTAWEWIIKFDYLGVGCIKKDEIEESVARRNASLLANYVKQRPVKHFTKPSLLKIIRLGFVLVVENHEGQTLFDCIFSDEIYDEIAYKRLELHSLNPAEVPSSGGYLAIYSETATTGISRSDVKAKFLLRYLDSMAEYEAVVKDIKTHLIIVQTPDIAAFVHDERVSATVAIYVGPAVSSGLDLVFVKGLPTQCIAAANRKRRR